MSRSLILKTLAVASFGVGIGAGSMAFFEREEMKPLRAERGTASVSPLPSKRQMLGKHLSVVQVSLQAPEGIADHEGQETVLVGHLRLNQPVQSDLRYRWDIPSGVTVVSGHLEDTVSDVQAGQSVEVRLSVVGFSKDDLKLVTLQGFVQDGDALLGNSAVLTSRPEDSYEMLAVAAGVHGSLKPAKKPVLKGRILR